MDCRTRTHKFRANLGFKQYDVILTIFVDENKKFD